MGVMYACCSLCKIVRTCQCVGRGLCYIPPRNTSGVAPWTLDCNSPVFIGVRKGRRLQGCQKCFDKVFAQKLNRIMAWWQQRRSPRSFFQVNPGKKLRGFPAAASV